MTKYDVQVYLPNGQIVPIGDVEEVVIAKSADGYDTRNGPSGARTLVVVAEQTVAVIVTPVVDGELEVLPT